MTSDPPVTLVEVALRRRRRLFLMVLMAVLLAILAWVGFTAAD